MRLPALLGLVMCLAPLAVAAEPLPSGSTFLSEELRARQNDDAANPGMLWVAAGSAMWREPMPGARTTCASCHGDASVSMRGVATRYPLVDKASGRLLNLEGRINQCRTERMSAPGLAYDSEPLLALTAYIARQSKGLPISVKVDGPAKPFFERGKAFFHDRRGQLNLSCANCHVDHAGRKLRSDTISHAVPSGYPIYRLEWQTLGSLHRRFRSCALGVRAVQHPPGSGTYLELELYLAHRARGSEIETPALRP